ncbi:MAG: hypothetical protein P1V35_07070 [Planctomycetota bacterium]|nr:hypothetical protein [Planctomycetota bacterium]
MTTQNNPEEDILTPEASHSTPISQPTNDSTEESMDSAISATPESTPTAQQSHALTGPGPTRVQAKPYVPQGEPKTKKPLLGLALFTSGLSMGALGCGLVLAKGPFADLVTKLQPLAERGLTGGSMILTGMVLTAMAIVERQLRKQNQAIEAQEANAAILQDIFGSMATIDARFDEIQTSERQVYVEANMMRNELHQFVVGQEGKDEQTGIFHVAASVDKLSAQVDRTLKGFGSDLQEKLRLAQEEAHALNAKLEAKMCELEPQEVPDNSEIVSAQADIIDRLRTMESNLRETQSQLGQVNESVQSSMQQVLDDKLEGLKPQEMYNDAAVLAGQSELADRLCEMERNLNGTQERIGQLGDCVKNIQPSDTYDDTAILVGQSEISERLCTMEENIRRTEEQLGEIGHGVQSTVQEMLEGLKPSGAYDDTAILVGQSEIGDRLCTMEENLRGTHERIDQIGENVQISVMESLEGVQPEGTRDDSVVMASHNEIVDRLKTMEGHLDSTRARFGEVQDAIQECVQDTLNDCLSGSVEEAVDSRIEVLRNELEQVSENVEAAVKCALDSAPAIQPTACDETTSDQQALDAFLTSENVGSPGVQTWPLEGPKDAPQAHRVQENPPLEILHMPTEEERASAVDTNQDQMAHALNHLFQPITSDQDECTELAEELFLDHIPQQIESDTNLGPNEIHLDGPTTPMPFVINGPSPIPGTPGSPFPAPVPLKPTDSDDNCEPPTEGPSNFDKPYEPPSDDTGFRFPGWN